MVANFGTVWADDDDDEDIDDFSEATSRADEDEDGSENSKQGDADDSSMAAKPPLILSQGKFLITGGVTISINPEIFKPFAIKPDLWYGLMSKLMVGVVHSPQGINGFYGGNGGFSSASAGGGLCLTGDMDGGCPEFYDGMGVLARYELMTGGLDLAADGGIIFASLSDATIAAKLGVVGRWVSGKISVWFSPNLRIGFTDRSFDVAGVSEPVNSEYLSLPVGVTYQVDDKITAGAQTGLSTFVSDFSDQMQGPLSFGGWYKVSDAMKGGAVWSFDNVFGKDGELDAMTLQLTGALVF